MGGFAESGESRAPGGRRAPGAGAPTSRTLPGMSLPLDELVRSAALGVRLHRVRSILVAAGFAAGTAAVVALFAITGGARAELLRQIRSLGPDLVSVTAVGAGSPPALTVDDARALAASFGFVRAVAPVRAVESSVLLPDERVTVRVLGTTADYFALRRLRFARGRPFTAAEVDAGAPVAVLGASAARRLFPGGDAYGSLVKVGGNWYRVIGVLDADPAAAGLASEEDARGREVVLTIPNTFQRDLSGRQSLREILLRIDERVPPERGAAIVERALVRRHEGRQHFAVATADALIRQQRAARTLLDTLLRAIAALAFALGGAAMAALSWQGVAERKREIAIRRAVGARRADVLAQFVLEGALLAAAGAAGGAVAGAVASAGAAAAGGWPWAPSPLGIAGALGLAIGVGVAATLPPAYRAAMLDPVTALRFER